MTITHTRVDERLIHGQVTVRWTKEYPIDTIVVANDAAANDEVQKMLLPLSAPTGVRTEILAIEDAASYLNGAGQDRKVFLIVKRPADLVRLLDAGVELREINVGNMSHREGSRPVKKSVHVTQEDVEAFGELDRRGVRMTGRMMPEEKDRDFMDYLKESV